MLTQIKGELTMEHGNAESTSGANQEAVSDNLGGDTVKYETFKKVLGEKKKRDEELTNLRARLESYEQEKLESEGKKDEVIASLRAKAEKFENELKQTRQNFVWNAVESQFKAEAQKHGCVDTNAFMKLIDRNELKSLEVTDDYQVNKDDLARLIEESKKQYSNLGLFAKKDIKVHDVKGKPTLKQPSLEEEAAKCKTPEEFALFMKKHGIN